MSETAERFRRRAAAFECKVAAIRPEQWSNPSPCARWDARGVVRHVVEMHAAMLSPLGRSLSAAPTVEQEPLAAFRSARADVQAVLDDEQLAASACETPSGSMSAEAHIDAVLSDDLVLHGWDLAKATGQDPTLDPTDVPRLWATATSVPADLMQRLRTPGAFAPGVEVYGPEVTVPEGASLQDRLLGFTGRDPRWSPS